MLNFFGTSIAYNKDLGPKQVVMYTCSVVGFFLVFSLIFTTINIVSKLWKQLRFANQENMKLLNNMHEGLIILKKPEKEGGERPVMFCNKPAQKLLSSFDQSKKIYI